MRLTLTILLLVPFLALAAGPTLDRNPQDYFALGIHTTALKDLIVDAPGCNVGVDCPNPPFARCGTLRAKGGVVKAPGQLVGDNLCATGSFFEVFRNNANVCGPACSAIGNPGSSPDCTEPFAPPILGDLDSDGNPSCDAQCRVDEDDVALACGVTLPLPACDPSRPVVVQLDQDCGGTDLVPGNFRCDLPAGVYGAITVRDGARLVLAPGETVACRLNAGKATRITSSGPATLIVPGRGDVQLNNFSDDGTTCGELRIVTERGKILLGKQGEYTLDACSIEGKLGLGNGNLLRGHFVGDTLVSDRGSEGRCCPSSTTTTTTTTTTVTTTTTTTVTTTTTTPSTTVTSSTATTSSTTSTTHATTTTTSSTTTTTQPNAWTRTPGFWKNHPSITLSILNSAGGLDVCGIHVTNVNVDSLHSALELMCIAVEGDTRLQLARTLMAAALNAAGGGAQFPRFAACNAICADPNASGDDVSGCIDGGDAFNNSGDALLAPFDPSGSATPSPCKAAKGTACSVSSPGDCGP